MKKGASIFIVILSLVFFYKCAHAQYLNIKLGDGDNEPSIMMNSLNVSQMVVATNKGAIYNSSDTGKNWNAQTMPNSNLFSGDPCIIVDTQNTFYFFSLGGTFGNPNWLDELICYRSYDGGATWPDSSRIGKNSPKDQDKEWAVVDRATNTIYMTWTEFDTYGSSNSNDSTRILFSKSSDKAHTWTTPLRINSASGDCIDDDLSTEGAVPTVGPNGEVYVAWCDIDGIKFDRSFNAGNTWMQNDILVSSQPGGWNYDIPGIYRTNGLPIIDCDRSNSLYKGKLYINWTDQLNGPNDTDVWISSSTDSGNTWSPRKRVNDDPPGKHQFFSWMTVDQSNGTVYVVFYDRRNSTANQTDVFLAKSTDGGATFINEKISNSSFTPNSSAFFGDYTNITASNNIVRPIWTRSDGSSRSVWTALINNTSTQTSNLDKQYNIQIYPMPVHNIFGISYSIQKNEILNVELFDVSGRKIKSVELPSNEQYATLDIAQQAAGLYSYVVLLNNQQVLKGKLIKN